MLDTQGVMEQVEQALAGGHEDLARELLRDASQSWSNNQSRKAWDTFHALRGTMVISV